MEEQAAIPPIPTAHLVPRDRRRTVPRLLPRSLALFRTVTLSPRLQPTVPATTSHKSIESLWKSSPRGIPCLATRTDTTAPRSFGLAMITVSLAPRVGSFCHAHNFQASVSPTARQLQPVALHPHKPQRPAKRPCYTQHRVASSQTVTNSLKRCRVTTVVNLRLTTTSRHRSSTPGIPFLAQRAKIAVLSSSLDMITVYVSY